MYLYPSDHKIRFKVEPIDGKSLSECDFTVSLFVTNNKKIKFKKSDCAPVDNDNDTYTVTFNTKDIGRGTVRMSLNIRVPKVGENRIFVKSIKGAKVNEADWRDATQEERDAWEKAHEQIMEDNY